MAGRPTYETEENREDQRLIAAILREVWPVDVKVTPRFATADYKFGQDGKLVAIGEHKRRFVRSDAYPTLILSRAKARKLLLIAYKYDINCLVLAHYDDCLMFAQLKNEHLAKSRPAGRTDRGDIHDIESCIEMHPAEFKKVRIPEKFKDKFVE